MSVDEEIAYPREPVYTAKEYDELKAEVDRLKNIMENALNLIGDNMDFDYQDKHQYFVQEEPLDMAMELLLDTKATEEKG